MLKFFNTLSRKKEVFKPLKGKGVRIYSCGPTVYDFPHIGNYRAYIFSDLLRRYLKWKGYKVKQVMNITDVDDKTIKGSRKEKISLRKFTKRYEDAFFEDLEKLNIEKVEVYPRATEHIKEMVMLIKKLLKKKYAYKSRDGIYFDVSKFRDYGKLADIRGLKAGVRVKQDEYDKKEVRDFSLWKFWDKEDGDVFWETEFGKGRPGWHIECSAMSMKYLGEGFDIHTGGVDLIFPHHENEIAQSEGATGKKFVRYWLHNEHLLVNGKKMSKSLYNFYTLRDILNKGYDSKAVRYLLLSTHYRQQLNFTFKGLEAAKNAVNRLGEFVWKVKDLKSNKEIKNLIKKVRKQFEEAMEDDLNVAKALAVIFDFVKVVNTSGGGGKEVYDIMIDFDKVLGLDLAEEIKIPKDILDLAKKREEARNRKDFKSSDKLRERLKKRGYVIEDLEGGFRIKKD